MAQLTGPRPHNFDRRTQSYPTKNNFNNISFDVSTIDKNDLKSINIFISGWFECENKRKLERLNEKLKSFVLKNRNPYYFKDMCISIDTVPYRYNGYGYVSYDITLFTTRRFKIDRREMAMIINPLLDKIYDQFFKEPTEFHVEKTKSKKQLV